MSPRRCSAVRRSSVRAGTKNVGSLAMPRAHRGWRHPKALHSFIVAAREARSDTWRWRDRWGIRCLPSPPMVLPPSKAAVSESSRPTTSESQPTLGRRALMAVLDRSMWTIKRVEHMVAGVRARLSATGVTGLTRVEVGEPVGNTLQHNLICELVDSGTLIAADLELLDQSVPHMT